LSEALKDLVKKMTAGTTVKAEFTLKGEQQKIPPESETELLRIGRRTAAPRTPAAAWPQ